MTDYLDKSPRKTEPNKVNIGYQAIRTLKKIIASCFNNKEDAESSVVHKKTKTLIKEVFKRLLSKDSYRRTNSDDIILEIYEAIDTFFPCPLLAQGISYGYIMSSNPKSYIHAEGINFHKFKDLSKKNEFNIITMRVNLNDFVSSGSIEHLYHSASQRMNPMFPRDNDLMTIENHQHYFVYDEVLYKTNKTKRTLGVCVCFLIKELSPNHEKSSGVIGYGKREDLFLFSQQQSEISIGNDSSFGQDPARQLPK